MSVIWGKGRERGENKGERQKGRELCLGSKRQNIYVSPTWVAQVVGASSHIHRKVAGFILSQGTNLGCGFYPQSRHV